MLSEHYPDITVELVGGGRGDFIVTADGTTLWNKKAEGGFPSEPAMVKALGALR